jgi:hypothetical protein
MDSAIQGALCNRPTPAGFRLDAVELERSSPGTGKKLGAWATKPSACAPVPAIELMPQLG